MDISVWLRELGLERYEQAFRDLAIDAELLPTLTADDLSDLAVTIVGHHRKLLNAIAALRGLSEKNGTLTPAPTATPVPGPQLVPKHSEAAKYMATACSPTARCPAPVLRGSCRRPAISLPVIR